MLPADYATVMACGTQALRERASTIRGDLTRGVPEPGPLWLVVRDLEGFALRLERTEDWEWRSGWAEFSFTLQDVQLLRDLAADAEPSPYKDAVAEDHVERQRQAFAELAAFLWRYDQREFAFDQNARPPEEPSGA